jgi:hypothetical protein
VHRRIRELFASGSYDRFASLVARVTRTLVTESYRVGAPVETTEVAPTILGLLGLNPSGLQAVRIEHTPALPGLAASH